MNFIPQSLSPITMVETNSYSTGCMSSDDNDEEEDMANCLIMLAQSVSPLKQDFCSRKTKLLKIRSVTEMTGTGFECKTCNRVFPSFQALGGHRASHKKPKLTDNRQPELEHLNIITNKSCYDIIQTGCKNIKPKVHECSICGSEFLSGQALGGHMRRHRASVPAEISSMKGKLLPEVTTSRNVMEKSPVMCLDLNFPPPEVVDDGDHSSLQFSSSHKGRVVFPAAPLVDCYY